MSPDDLLCHDPCQEVNGAGHLRVSHFAVDGAFPIKRHPIWPEDGFPWCRSAPQLQRGPRVTGVRERAARRGTPDRYGRRRL